MGFHFPLIDGMLVIERMKTELRLMVMLVLVHVGLLTYASALEPLVRVEQIRSLTREEAAQARPVKLSGVIVYNSSQSLVLHDGRWSIYLDFEYARKKGIWKGAPPDFNQIKPGTEVEIEGVTDPGGFSPMVMVAKLKPLGSMPMPPPIRSNIENLLSSSLDSQWIEVQGVVRKMKILHDEYLQMTLLTGGHSCEVILSRHSGLSRDSLVDARIRLRGVLLNIVNLRSQTAGIKIHSNGASDIDVMIPPPTDPFSAPKVVLNRLVSFQPDADLGHRRVSSGVVTFAVPGRFFYLLDQDVCVRVDSTEARVTPGDLVEVAGFIDTSRVLASFSEALVRKIGSGTVPSPAEPSISDILNPETRSEEEMIMKPGHRDYDGRLIRLGGVLRRVLPPDKNGNSTVVVESGSHLIYGLLPGAAPSWSEGSTVELTGACELEIARIAKFPWFAITGFHVWLSSPEGVRVISEPPWWTPQRLGILLSAVMLVLVAALVWGYAMRRQVAIRGAQLATEITARKSAQIEFDSILHERQRLANDLHDTLEQALMGVALQLEIANRSRASNPSQSGHHLALAQQFLERSRSEVHRTVWDLRTQGQDGRDFLDILDERVSSMVEGSGITITLKREGDAFPMPDLIAGNLLLVAQEAVTNALKHSEASEIRIALRTSNADVELVISDNGRGFDPMTAPSQDNGHFGLQGMRERIKRLDGTIELSSTPGRGTILRLWVTFPPVSGDSGESA